MLDSATPVLRFAPSPNGLLHLGHAYSALLNFTIARRRGGRFLLRIEDIDRDRCRPEFETAIKEDLAWLGLEWEEPVRRQSQHFADYSAALAKLAARGLIYPCFCTRGDIARAVAARKEGSRDPDGGPLYPGTCKHLSALERVARIAARQSAAFRLDIEAALAQTGTRFGWREYGEGNSLCEVTAEPSLWGDPIVARRDFPTSYHIAVVVDDAEQGVTDVVRGRDLFDATSLQRLLQVLLDLPAPNYRHHRLLLGENGQKLSKSTHARSIRSMREAGVSAVAIRRQLGFD
jgi:glutamyl-Q tRNA(Asp) synthetase